MLLNGRDAAKLSQAVDTLKDQGIAAHGYPFDVTDAVGIDQAVGAMEREVGPVDILVNNRGHSAARSFGDL